MLGYTKRFSGSLLKSQADRVQESINTGPLQCLHKNIQPQGEEGGEMCRPPDEGDEALFLTARNGWTIDLANSQTEQMYLFPVCSLN